MNSRLLSVLAPALLGFALWSQPLHALANEPEPRSGWSLREVSLIPVQSNGRIKPLDTFAREVILFETGSRGYPGWRPADLLLSWISAPARWEKVPFIKVDRDDVKRQLGLDVRRKKFSPDELVHNSFLAQYASDASLPKPPGAPKPGPREQELKRVLDRLGLFRSIASGDGWPVVPVSGQAASREDAWKNLNGREKEGELIRGHFAAMVLAYDSGDQETFVRSAREARAAVQGQVPGWSSHDENAMVLEYLYQRLRPFLWSWIFYCAGAIFWFVVIVTRPAAARVTARNFSVARLGAWFFTWGGLLMHVLGMAMRSYIAGRPPVTNMYESIIWVAFGAVLFGLILYGMRRQAVLLSVACALGTLGLIAADAAPALMDPGLHPLVPVLRSNYWLTVHVLTITLSYAAFALSLGLANVTLFQYLRGGTGLSERVAGLNLLTYRAMQFGVVLVAAGTILGGVWADYSWGRFWGWDPKEVWALIVLLGYLAILHGRYAGWVGQFGFAVWSVVSFLTVIMAWYGVNFILGVGLHSYGFSTGGQLWVGLFTLIQLAYVGFVVLRKRSITSR